MAANTPKLFFESVKYSLDSIKYKGLSQQKEGVEVSLNTHDDYSIISVTTEAISLHISRHIEFKPKSIFNLSLTASMFLPLNQTDKKFKGTIEELEAYANEHIDSIINNSSVMETVSLVVSQVSSAYGRVPIITPPFFNSKDHSETK